MTTCQLSHFGLSPQRGFLPDSDPLHKLASPEFAAWERVAQNLPKFLSALSLRKTVNALPPFPVARISNEQELRRAMVILSFIGHAYVYGEQPIVDRIPAVLAQPWYEVAFQLGRPPVLSYASYALDNWQRIDPHGPIEMGNIALLQNFLGGIDEEWFIIVHVDIEAKAAQALTGIQRGRAAVIANNPGELLQGLTEIHSSLEAMYAALCRMVDHCDPFIYFHRVRPYIHGWKNNPALPHGLMYEGVPQYAGAGQLFRGETGAQSCIIPCLDGFLGISHQPDVLKTYLMEMREYMPAAHRLFLEATEAGPSTRDFVTTHPQAPGLLEQYDSCVTWVEKFRSKHLEYAVSYIAQQSTRNPANPSQIGTGGTPFVQYLTKHRDETGAQTLGTKHHGTGQP